VGKRCTEAPPRGQGFRWSPTVARDGLEPPTLGFSVSREALVGLADAIRVTHVLRESAEIGAAGTLAFDPAMIDC